MAIKEASDDDFKKILKENDKVVVKYYADWCGSCRLFKPKYNKLSEQERFQDVLFIDVNAGRSPEARKAAGVSNLPYFAVFKEGTLIDAVAYAKEEAVAALIEKLK